MTFLCSCMHELRSCHAVHMRTDCDMMCKSPAYKTIQFLLYAMRQTKQTQGDQIMRQLLTQLTSDVDDCITKRRAGQSMGAHWHVCMCVHSLYVSCMGPIYIHAALHAGDDSCCLSVKCRGPSLYFCYKWQRNIDYQWLLCV